MNAWSVQESKSSVMTKAHYEVLSQTSKISIQLKGELMITVNIYYTGANGSALKFAQAMESQGIADDIRAQAGNIRYEYFIPMNDSETVLLIDSWTSQSALDAHHASAMMGRIVKLRDEFDLHMKVERYSSDELGAPESDKRFIRE